MANTLNWGKALEAVDGSEEILRELAEVFLNECPNMMQQVRAALDARDASALRNQAHTIKGAVRVFMAEPARQAAFRLETMGRDGDLAEGEEAWINLNKEVKRLNAALADRLGSSSVGE